MELGGNGAPDGNGVGVLELGGTGVCGFGDFGAGALFGDDFGDSFGGFGGAISGDGDDDGLGGLTA